jgi:hypothetical protein
MRGSEVNDSGFEGNEAFLTLDKTTSVILIKISRENHVRDNFGPLSGLPGS